jgi:hypothetical protein
VVGSTLGGSRAALAKLPDTDDGERTRTAAAAPAGDQEGLAAAEGDVGLAIAARRGRRLPLERPPADSGAPLYVSGSPRSFSNLVGSGAATLHERWWRVHLHLRRPPTGL